MTDTLSIEDAVDAVLTQEGEIAPSAAPDPGEPEDGQPQEGETVDDIPGDQPGTDEAAETPAEDAGGAVDAPVKPAAEAPAHWSSEGKAVFSSLAPEAQQAILAEAKASERVTAKKLDELANERKTLTQSTQRVLSAAEKAEQVFAGRWDGITPEAWAELARTEPQKYTALKAQFDAETAANQQIQSARKEAEEAQHAEWLEEQRQVLASLAPDLVDPVKGAENQQQLFSYLIQNGATKEGIEKADAVSLSIARKAMLYDAGVAKLTAPKPQPAPAKPALTPSAAQSDNPQQRNLSNAQNRLAKTGSIDDAVAVLLARQTG